MSQLIHLSEVFILNSTPKIHWGDSQFAFPSTAFRAFLFLILSCNDPHHHHTHLHIGSMMSFSHLFGPWKSSIYLQNVYQLPSIESYCLQCISLSSSSSPSFPPEAAAHSPHSPVRVHVLESPSRQRSVPLNWVTWSTMPKVGTIKFSKGKGGWCGITTSPIKFQALYTIICLMPQGCSTCHINHLQLSANINYLSQNSRCLSNTYT